jgi:DMATS type aromatic prenyltransferase
MHEAGYPVDRQIESLLFHRFTIVPRLGPQPEHATPGFMSRIGGCRSDGTPIGYSWRWGVGDATPTTSTFVEPVGALTGTGADPLNEAAATELLWQLGKILPEADLSLFWKLAPKLKASMTDEGTPQRSSMLVGLEMAPTSSIVGLTTNIYRQAPKQVGGFGNVMAEAMRDSYGANIRLDSLNAVCDFMTSDPDGSQLILRGTIGIDCSRAQDAGIKCYAGTCNTSFDHIAAIMTLGGRNPVPSKAIDQLRELWYTLRGLEADFPTSAQLPSHESIAVNGGGIPDPSLLPFHFHIQAQPASTVVKAYFEVGDHAKSDIAAAKTLTGFLERRGRGGKTKDYLNAFQGLLSPKELHTRSGVQGYISVGFEKGELDITSYINPLAYRRFDEIKADLNKSTIVRQRRSRFE